MAHFVIRDVLEIKRVDDFYKFVLPNSGEVVLYVLVPVTNNPTPHLKSTKISLHGTRAIPEATFSCKQAHIWHTDMFLILIHVNVNNAKVKRKQWQASIDLNVHSAMDRGDSREAESITPPAPESGLVSGHHGVVEGTHSE